MKLQSTSLASAGYPLRADSATIAMGSRRVLFSIGVLLAVIVPILSACGSGGATLTKVTFMAGFKPQANLPFVAAYVAKDKGYFRE